MAIKLERQAERIAERLQAQREWIAKRGNDLAGYEAFYAGRSYSKDDVKEVFDADVERLARLRDERDAVARKLQARDLILLRRVEGVK
jgi:hypothetical protein